MTTGELKGDTWYLPAERTKNARAHVVPLSAPPARLWGAYTGFPALGGTSHTTTGTTPPSGFNRGCRNIAKRMARIAAEERGEPVDIPRWTFHDLRRTAATGMARIGIPVHVTEAVLNHVSGTRSGIVGVYQRHDYAQEGRQALEAWARFVMGLVEGKADNVARLVFAT